MKPKLAARTEVKTKPENYPYRAETAGEWRVNRNRARGDSQ